MGPLSLVCLQQQVSQADRSQLAQPDTALKGFKPTWPVPKEPQTLSHDYFALISEYRHATPPFSAIELPSVLVSQIQEILSSSFCPSTYFFCFPLSVSLMLLQNMWEPFFSYCLPPCNLHFSSIVPTNCFWNDLFLLTVLFWEENSLGDFLSPIYLNHKSWSLWELHLFLWWNGKLGLWPTPIKVALVEL